jgi:tetratricopeptide (TPR) repeat protein
MQDVFAIQDDITRAIMAALKLRLAGRSDQPAFKLQTTNAEAYELYLKGRYFWNQRGIGLRKSLHYFELALIEDPDYALAMSGLSDTYSLLSWYGDLPPAEAIPKAIAPAKQAVQLDPQLAEAHTSLGFCQLFNWDWAGAEREFRRARAFFGNRSNVSRVDVLPCGRVRRSRATAAKRERTGWGAAFRFRNLVFGQSLCCHAQTRPGVPRAWQSGGTLAWQRMDEVHAGSCLGRVW